MIEAFIRVIFNSIINFTGEKRHILKNKQIKIIYADTPTSKYTKVKTSAIVRKRYFREIWRFIIFFNNI